MSQEWEVIHLLHKGNICEVSAHGAALCLRLWWQSGLQKKSLYSSQNSKASRTVGIGYECTRDLLLPCASYCPHVGACSSVASTQSLLD